MAFFEKLKEKFSAAVLFVCNKIRHGWEIIRLSGEINTIKGSIRKQYEELGRRIYESKGQDMDAYREICDQLDECRERLEALTRRDEEIRSRNRCPRCGAVMNKKAKFCSSCGAVMPEAPAPSAEKETAPSTEE